MKDAKSTSRKVVLAAFLACFCLFGFRSTFSILQVPMGKDLGWTGSQLSMGYSLMMMVYAVTAFFAGKIVDKSGCRPVYFAGAVGATGAFCVPAAGAFAAPLAAAPCVACAG